MVLKGLARLSISTSILLLTTTHPLSADNSKVIYGLDNRLEYYEIDNSEVRTIADSTVALVKNYDLSQTSDGYKLNDLTTLGDSRNLCTSEPFRDQPSGAFCSGFLVAPKIIVTAGHCITSQSACEGISFVFGYHLAAPSVARTSFNNNEVYRCKNIIGREQVGSGADWAVIEIDREVENKTPLNLRTSGIASTGDDIFVIGHPSGLPLKFAPGAKVRSTNTTHFVANLDTYGGNSGSAVFNSANLEVQGILVRGETDYTGNDGCSISYQCEDDSCRGEDVTNINQICLGAAELCEVLGIERPSNYDNTDSNDTGSATGPNSCEYANDGTCDDGRPGSSYSICTRGTDENDCSSIDSSNSCEYARDNSCDDGRPGSSYSVCAPGTDEYDCTVNFDYQNSCDYANDGTCDDGRPGSSYSICTRGTDENDCREL